MDEWTPFDPTPTPNLRELCIARAYLTTRATECKTLSHNIQLHSNSHSEVLNGCEIRSILLKCHLPWIYLVGLPA